jgi:hypothetical protein
MTVQPVVGAADDFLVKLITEMGSEVQASTLDHIGIDDRKLVDEAIELPQILFYYGAVEQRIALRVGQLKIELKETEAREFISIVEEYRTRGERMGVDEATMRVTMRQAVSERRHAVNALEAKLETVKGVLTALRQKGYSLQLVASVRSKEEDWLRQSFQRRFKDHPAADRVNSLLEQMLGPSIK